MPKAIVSKPFNFREGGTIKTIPKGEQSLTPAAFAYAKSNDLLVQTKQPAEGKEAASATR